MTGQARLAGLSVFVHENIHKGSLNQFTSQAKDINSGDPLDLEIEMGPVAFRD